MPPATHELVKGFDRAAAAYERGRPEYPPAAIAHLTQVLGLGPGRTVLDLGAGTGKLTRALRPTGARLLAVEPTGGMREEFRRALPDVELLEGTAEAIPSPDGSVDAVMCGQAFHWFEPESAAREIARVLRAGGGLGLVWNMRDETVPWVAKLTAILDRYDPGGPRGRDRRWRAPLEATGRFAPLSLRSFPHVQRLDRAAMAARVLSVSFIAVRPPEEQEAVRVAVDRLLDDDPATRGRAEVDLPYRTDVFWTFRR